MSCPIVFNKLPWCRVRELPIVVNKLPWRLGVAPSSLISYPGARELPIVVNKLPWRLGARARWPLGRGNYSAVAAGSSATGGTRPPPLSGPRRGDWGHLQENIFTIFLGNLICQYIVKKLLGTKTSGYLGLSTISFPIKSNVKLFYSFLI